jgi:hypothetical protein
MPTRQLSEKEEKEYEEAQKQEEEKANKRKQELTAKPFSKLTEEEQIELKDLWAEDEWEEPEEDEPSETEEREEEEVQETEPQKTEEETRNEQRRRILNKIEAQVDLSDFWQEVLNNKGWNDILRIYYRLNAGLVQKFYASFTIRAVRVGDRIEWTYSFFDENNKEVFFDALNTAKVAE